MTAETSTTMRQLLLSVLLVPILLVSSGNRAVATPTCASVRLCIAIDGSGSINSTEFTSMKNGLANAIKDPTVVPQDGSVELSFVQFGSAITTHVTPTVINSQATANSVGTALLGIVKDDGGTFMSGAINQCNSLITGSCGTSRQVINVVTDGSPNSESDTITARNNAISAGIDEINAEAIDAPTSAFDFLLKQLVHPQPGVVAPPFTSPGFVIRTDSFEDFAEAVRGKIGQIVGPHECYIDPEIATNPVGSLHSFTVTVLDTGGDPAEGVTVNVEVISGPNTGVSGSAATGVAGTVTAQYTDTHGPGRDTIQASGTVGGTPFLCTATKVWGPPPPPCTVHPAVDANPVETWHTVTATFLNGDLTPAVDVIVSVGITGPNTLFADAVTNEHGQVVLTYQGSSEAGTDVIEFAGLIDGEFVECSATKTWFDDPPTCEINPPSAVNLTGTQHSMTVTVRHGDGSPAHGVSVDVDVLSGPNAGRGGSGSTDGSGNVMVQYLGSGGTGTDSIQASGSLDGEHFSCSASKIWENPPPPCTVDPASATNFTGSSHTVTANFTHGDGSPATGVTVAVTVSAPNAKVGNKVTDSHGDAVWTYTGTNPGTDTIHFSGTVDGHAVSCSASKTWETPPPPCTVDPPSATNFIGTEHIITATFKRADASPAPGVNVSIDVSGSNSAGGSEVTDSDGKAEWAYSGTNEGGDTIHFSGVVDGYEVTCSATKTWEIPPPPCTVDPSSATNFVGTEHAVTATFTRADGSPAVGVDVGYTISGVSPSVFGDGETDGSGQLAIVPYTGLTEGVDTIDFSGVVDGYEVTCSATKTWEIPPPPCTVSPATGTNPVGAFHTVVATFRSADGSLAEDVEVAYAISGAGPSTFGDGETDESGQLAIVPYTSAHTGTDTIEFSGVVDGHEVTCSATKTWVAARPTCNAVPTTAVNRVGALHTVTATFTRADGSPAAWLPVSLIISGPNGRFIDHETDAHGQAAWSYESPTVGTDVFEFSAFLDGEVVSCSATKTWVTEHPTCEVSPSMDVNPVGTQHFVSAIFRGADGAPVEGAEVAFSISGASPLVLGHAITDAGGQVAVPAYTGDSPGTDVIEFSGFVDNELVTCSATKTWLATRPACTAFPSTAVNRVQDRHLVGAVFRNMLGFRAGGVPVSIRISGPNGLTLVDHETNRDGIVAFSYESLGTGTDVIEFSASIDDQIVSCTATKTWVGAQPTCSVLPTTAVNPTGTLHTVTGTFTRSNGLPAAGADVSIAVSGPNAAFITARTDGSGQVSWTYESDIAGTDVIAFSASIDGQLVDCTGTKTWVRAQPSCNVVPATAVNPTGTLHTVTGTFTRSNGLPAAGVDVALVISGPNSAFIDARTDGSGQVSWTYESDIVGTDVFDFNAFFEGQVVSCRAAKTWVAAQPTCKVIPTTAVNPTGTQHTVTGTFTRSNGLPAAGVDVSLVISGPNSAFIDTGTDGSGQASWSYQSDDPGTDVFQFSAFFDGQIVRCSGTKTWVRAQPTCSVLPPTAVNPVGTEHTVTGTFTRGDGSPAAGVRASVRILSGPSVGGSTTAVTDATGLAEPPRFGSDVAGTDVIEFSGFVDGQVVTCRGTKTWVGAQRPTCQVVPPTAVNPAGTSHTVAAVFTRGDGSPAAGVPATVSISSGPHAGSFLNGTTNANGRAEPPPYFSNGVAGTDVIDFSATVDGQLVTCSGTKTWVAAQPTCSVIPATAVNPVGSSHSFAAAFRRGDGSPAAGVNVSGVISSGPNAGFAGGDVTNAAGVVQSPPYLGLGGPGTDVVDFSATVDGQLVTCRGTKTWIGARATCDAAPATAVNPVGSSHTVIATFRRGDGSPAAGVGVSINIAGPNPGVLNKVTNISGQVTATNTGGVNPGTDVLTFTGSVDGQVVSCQASKTWIVAQPTCSTSPGTAVNPAGTQHVVSAIFRRGNGLPAAGVGVSINIAGVNSVTGNLVTDASGQVTWAYTGGLLAGTDLIDFSATVDTQPVRCRATKTWVAAQPACDVIPASATNQAGTQHSMTATFRRGDGRFAAGVPVSINIAGPNPVSTTSVTNGAGQAQFAYIGGSQAGTDIIDFSATVDGQLVSCRATKSWAAVQQATCAAAPATAVNRVGRPHVVTATFRRADGSPATGVNVSIGVSSGPNSALRKNLATNASGEVRLSYIGTAAGTDVVEFSGTVDGQNVNCRADKTWVVGQPACAAIPATAVNAPGTQHAVTASFTRADGTPAAGVAASIEIASGPNSPFLNNGTTDGTGQVLLSYTGGANAGTDTINFSGFVDGQTVRCSATKTWVGAQATCEALPATASNPAGTQHTVTATFRKGDGSAAAGVSVAIGVTGGSKVPLLENRVTDPTGQVAYSYTGGANASTDTIEFSGLVDGQDVRCTATKKWAAALPTCVADPATDVNPLGTPHSVTATFRRPDGSPVAGVNVAISIPSGPNSALSRNRVTDANGAALLSYIGSSDGTDVIEFSGLVDGQSVSCTATKTWGDVPPACDAVPSTAMSPNGTEHVVTAIFRRGDGSPAMGVNVDIDVTSGPNSSADTTAVTNSNGQARLSYTGNTTGTDVIEFSGLVDGQTVSCRANTTWQGGGLPPTPTGTRLTPTPTPTPTPTRIPGCAFCVGDCNRDCEVTVDELVTGINIALGIQGVERCPEFDEDGSIEVEVNELVTGVNNALQGCPPVGEPTETPIVTVTGGPPVTETPGGPTETPGPGDEIQAVAGGSSVLVNTMGVIPGVVAAVVTGIELSDRSRAAYMFPEDGGGAGACPLGGSATRSGSFPFLTVTLASCKVATSDGAVTFDGSLSVQLASFSTDVEMRFEDGAGSENSTAIAVLAGTLSPALGGDCFLTSATMTVSNGTLTVREPGGEEVSVAFTNTQIVVGHITFSTQCIPEIYRLTFTGPASLLGPTGDPIDVTLDNLVMDVDDSSDPAFYQLSGAMSSACFGGAATITTDTVLSLRAGELCPTDGAISVSLPGGAAKILYRSDGSVDIDEDADGSIDQSAPNCLDPRLLSCLA